MELNENSIFYQRMSKINATLFLMLFISTLKFANQKKIETMHFRSRFKLAKKESFEWMDETNFYFEQRDNI